MDLISISSKLLQTKLKAHGINIGLNMGGKAAGGSVPEHIHFHVIPRWFGDTNFLSIVSETKVITLDLNNVYEELYTALL
jgi:ATP adenylyltransferase